MQQANRVLELLYDRRGQYISLDELALMAELSIEQLDNVCRQLKQRGQQLDRRTPTGIALCRPIRLDGHLIERNLGTKRVAKHVICFEEVDSTNDIAFSSAQQDGANGLVVLAEYQRRGRGRMARKWLASPRANIMMSLLLAEAAADIRAGSGWVASGSALTIAAGLAVAEGIESVCGVEAQLKWPNDVVLSGRKVAGILVELRRVGKVNAAVVGLGVNVNAAPEGVTLRHPATSLAAETGCEVERTEVVRAILRRLDDWVDRILAEKLEGLHDAWISRCSMLGERITVMCNGRRHVGRALDVKPLEGLVLQPDQGPRFSLPAEGCSLLDD